MSSPLVAVSLKAYLGARASSNWVRAVMALPQVTTGPVADGSVELALLPSFPLLVPTGAAIAESAVTLGAQDCAPSAAGAQTGEVTAQLLAELGVRYVEVGHAERRRLFGEDDAMCAAKTAQAIGNGLVPLICVGEERRGDAADAATECVRQLRALTAPSSGSTGTPRASGAGDDSNAPAGPEMDAAELVVAYEPVWAIGADEPASPEHVVTVCQALRAELARRSGKARILYGGSAGPGTFARIATGVDGLFLGRFAHDAANLGRVLDEVAAESAASLPSD